jgi:hypothetical protein
MAPPLLSLMSGADERRLRMPRTRRIVHATDYSAWEAAFAKAVEPDRVVAPTWSSD